MDAFQLIGSIPDRQFEYIYIAPPQYKGIWKDILLKVDANLGWLSQDGWVIVQIHPVEYEELSEKEGLIHLQRFDQRRYGSTLLVFYR